MATSQGTIDHLLDTLSNPRVTARKMFGEYALYVDAKVTALVCDDQVFIKPSTADVSFREQCEAAPPYPGAKHYWLVPEDLIHDRDWLRRALESTAGTLPSPKQKVPRQ